MTIAQCLTGAGSNPRNILMDDGFGRTYVTLYDRAELLFYDRHRDPNCSSPNWIDLASFADSDGVPEMDQMVLSERHLFVVLRRLDRDGSRSAIEPGALVAIDRRTGEIVREIALSGDPVAITSDGIYELNDGGIEWQAKLLVTQSGRLGVLDGGIELVDPGSMTAEGFWITEADLGGDLKDFVFRWRDRPERDGGFGYAVVSWPRFGDVIVSFSVDVETGINPESVTEVLRTGAISDIEMTYNYSLVRGGREVWIADQTAGQTGIRILRYGGTELTPVPIDVGMPPSKIGFLE